MHIEEYINDPSRSRQDNLITHDFYLGKLNAIIEREKKLPTVAIYYEKDDIWFHVKVPDEEMTGFYYDVVLAFHPNSKLEVEAGDILGYDVHFFSNDPGFIFKFCYEFNQNKLLVEPLKTRLNSKALNIPANQTNPNHELRYPKTIYFAYLTLEKMNLFKKPTIKAYRVQKLNRSLFVASIPNDTYIYNKRQTRTKTVKNINRAVTRITKPFNDIRSAVSNTKIVGGTKTAKSTGHSKTANNITGVKKTKRK